MKYWLMKSEPEELSIDQLAKDQTTWWTGVRNYQARNFMLNDMKVGDRILFYHSNAEPSGVFGIAYVTKPAEVDSLQFDQKSDYFDPKSKREKPIWFCVEVGFECKFERSVSLSELKSTPQLKDMLVIKKGMRLSVQPVTKFEFEFVCKLGNKAPSKNKLKMVKG